MNARASITRGLLMFAAAGAIAAACVPLWHDPPKFCTTNAECGEGLVCFPDGCGDPGRDLKVQVTFAQQAQEFEVNELQGAVLDEELSRPPFFTGLIRQDTATGPVAFTGSVTLKASGTALFLGLPRRVELPLQPLAGQYVLPVHTGKYTSVGAFSSDTSVPPVWLENTSGWTLAPGSIVHEDIVFPAASQLVRVSGSLLLSTTLGAVTAPMQVQVLELNTGRPLSQPVAVDPAGNFTVLASPKATAQQYVEILATPRDTALSPGTIVPSRLFTNVPITGAPLVLEMGEFGEAVSLSGRVLGPDGQPVGSAVVYTERTQQDRTNYKSAAVVTGPDGTFQVKALPTLAVEDGVSLWVVPPSGSPAATQQVVMSVPITGGSVGDLRCRHRIQVRGQVLRPDGQEPAEGVNVSAEPVGGVPGHKPPTFSQEDTTDLEGRFSFFADPGEYRLDFHPPDLLPRVSKRVTVDTSSPLDPPPPIDVPAFTLWNGRRLGGRITGFANSGATIKTALPSATVEIFRVTFEGAKQVSFSLAKTTTDTNGMYEVILPTAPSSADGGTPAPDAG